MADQQLPRKKGRDVVKIGSERGFGLVFTVVFAVISLFPLLRGSTVRWWSIVVALVLLTLAFVRPVLLRPLNLVWCRFGLLLHRITNPRYHALMSAFHERTGCPVVVNTSFNVRGEPIVCTPEDAFRCFMGTELDALAVGNAVLYKDRQEPSLKLDYRDTFELD